MHNPHNTDRFIRDVVYKVFGNATMTTKYCSKCKQDKPLYEFGTASGTKKDGYNSWCKQCVRDAAKRHRHTPSGIFSTIKQRQTYLAKRKDSRTKPFNISREWFVAWYKNQPLVCGYCGIPQEKWYLMAERYNSNWFRLTIDCMDNDAGYIEGNLVLSCAKCNLIKQNILTHDDMVYIGQNFVKPKWESLI